MVLNMMNSYEIEFVDDYMKEEDYWPIDTGSKSMNLPIKVKMTKK